MLVTEPPHVILRQGLIQGLTYTTLSSDVSIYLARSLFFSSGLHLTGVQLREAVERWSGNRLMCELTEQVLLYVGAIYSIVLLGVTFLNSVLPRLFCCLVHLLCTACSESLEVRSKQCLVWPSFS